MSEGDELVRLGHGTTVMRGAARARWPSWSSKPVRPCSPRLGRFDSGAAPLSRIPWPNGIASWSSGPGGGGRARGTDGARGVPARPGTGVRPARGPPARRRRSLPFLFPRKTLELGRYANGPHPRLWMEVRDVACNSRLVALAIDVCGHHRRGRVRRLLLHEASPGRLAPESAVQSDWRSPSVCPLAGT